MRNIALLEWGPASLYYLQPREKVKVRTKWLEGGPTLTPFLSTLEDARAEEAEICVRYAFSAFEDLNAAIKNLRKCFGFPYQEHIGYLNTLTRTHRARREHEALLPGLRRWAIIRNVHAVVWIDYAKSNQPPGSVKVGPRDSCPFHPHHMELCSSVEDLDAAEGKKPRDVESDGGWSDDGHDDRSHTQQTEVKWTMADFQNDTLRPPSKKEGIGFEASHGLLQPVRKTRARAAAAAAAAAAGTAAPGGAQALGSSQALSGEVGAVATQASLDAGVSLSLESNSDAWPLTSRSRQNRSKMSSGSYHTALQEEFIPNYGSIYQRTIAPGPGYYGAGDLQSQPSTDSSVGPTFGAKQRSVFDTHVASVQDLPGPGEYEQTLPPAKPISRFGNFTKAARLVAPADAARKLPFISAEASACEILGSQGSETFHNIAPVVMNHTSGVARAPKFSFSRHRRPF